MNGANMALEVLTASKTLAASLDDAKIHAHVLGSLSLAASPGRGGAQII